jgi:hypothetical protein
VSYGMVSLLCDWVSTLWLKVLSWSLNANAFSALLLIIQWQYHQCTTNKDYNVALKNNTCNELIPLVVIQFVFLL